MDDMHGMDAAELGVRLRELEDKVDTILRYLGIAYPPGSLDPSTMPDVMQAVRAGRKIQAIKLYRERTGLSLGEAKDAIDELTRGR
ncbi:ribosomal protein L7/L12 [Embleya sp. AB8]|uniref:ribosomal protein L7/L12 n=1 Tax=Embleya sp. AB8 TaxID=3156304 RepID=UPI003C708495